ncbi:DUF406 family protein [Vibrio sp. MA40-2]|uniref:DUF406 family protein n=1 Tax=Vibrio sp. MA40-2 TaxID=3391828 RepID=UPI0039A59693
MSKQINDLNAENELCEACGVTAEVGFIIAEGDEVAEVSVFGDSKQRIEIEFEKYLSLAKQVCQNVKYETTPLNDQSTELHAKFQFEVSAEKLIFELKSRSIA